mmetsp:Transcript_33374/g.92300  ORF Transcript_33374/g.92300 Transcript_33374/m.92300 type:complete len:261 (-) Transcript_33374:369-1151(-)
MAAAVMGGVKDESRCAARLANRAKAVSGISSQISSAMSSSSMHSLKTLELSLTSPVNGVSSMCSAPSGDARAGGSFRAVPAERAASVCCTRCSCNTWRANWCSVHSTRCASLRSPCSEPSADCVPSTESVAVLLSVESIPMEVCSYFARYARKISRDACALPFANGGPRRKSRGSKRVQSCEITSAKALSIISLHSAKWCTVPDRRTLPRTSSWVVDEHVNKMACSSSGSAWRELSSSQATECTRSCSSVALLSNTPASR